MVFFLNCIIYCNFVTYFYYKKDLFNIISPNFSNIRILCCQLFLVGHQYTVNHKTKPEWVKWVKVYYSASGAGTERIQLGCSNPLVGKQYIILLEILASNFKIFIYPSLPQRNHRSRNLAFDHTSC